MQTKTNHTIRLPIKFYDLGWLFITVVSRVNVNLKLAKLNLNLLKNKWLKVNSSIELGWTVYLYLSVGITKDYQNVVLGMSFKKAQNCCIWAQSKEDRVILYSMIWASKQGTKPRKAALIERT